MAKKLVRMPETHREYLKPKFKEILDLHQDVAGLGIMPMTQMKLRMVMEQFIGMKVTLEKENLSITGSIESVSFANVDFMAAIKFKLYEFKDKIEIMMHKEEDKCFSHNIVSKDGTILCLYSGHPNLRLDSGIMLYDKMSDFYKSILHVKHLFVNNPEDGTVTMLETNNLLNIRNVYKKSGNFTCEATNVIGFEVFCGKEEERIIMSNVADILFYKKVNTSIPSCEAELEVEYAE